MRMDENKKPQILFWKITLNGPIVGSFSFLKQMDLQNPTFNDTWIPLVLLLFSWSGLYTLVRIPLGF